MEFDKDGNPITPKQPENGQDPSSQTSGVDYEQRFKDTQSAFTKERQGKIALANRLVEKDPAEIANIDDDKIKEKILQEKWGVDTVEELNIYYPEILKPKKESKVAEDLDEDSKVTELRRELEIIKLSSKKEKIQSAMSNIVNNNKEIVASIPDFEAKIKEELKFISDELTPEERVSKAFKLVTWGSSSTAEAYAVLQWLSGGNSSTPTETPKDDAEFNRIQNQIRVSMWLKAK